MLKTFRTLLASTVVLAAAACSDQSPTLTAPTGAPAYAVSTASTALKLAEQSEILRVAQEQVKSVNAYVKAKLDWELKKGLGVQRDPSIMVCEPLQYAGKVKIVGPAGGSIAFGPHTLSIPAGALAAPTVVTAEALMSPTVDARFSPHGLRFAKPVKLSMSYAHCNRPATYFESVVYVNYAHEILERPLSQSRGSYVDAWINHFSIYAVAE